MKTDEEKFYDSYLKWKIEGAVMAYKQFVKNLGAFDGLAYSVKTNSAEEKIFNTLSFQCGNATFSSWQYSGDNSCRA